MSCSSLALALLAEVFSTLGQPPPAVAGLALLAEEATELRARRGAAAAERALRSLQGQGHTDRLIALATATDLLTAAVPTEAAAEDFAEQLQLQLAAVACLTQIAATEAGATLLLDSRLLERLATAGSTDGTTTAAAARGKGTLAAPAEQQLPALRLVQALVASLPQNELLAAHLAGLLRAKARSMRDLLLLTERTAAAVAAAGAAAALLSHACQPEYYQQSRRVAGPEVVTVLTQCAVALLVELGSHPYPKGLLPVQRQARCANGYLRRVPAAASAGAAADWWSTVVPVTAAEQEAAQVPCTLPPGAVMSGSSSSAVLEVDWTLFHASLLQTAQAALGHAAALFRVAAAAAPGDPLLRQQFTGLGAALGACTQVYRATGAGAAEELGFVSSSSSSVFDAAAAAAAAAVDTSGYDTLPFSAAFVVESLLAGLLCEVTARSTDILESDTEALYAPLEVLARETSPYVSKAARCILEILNPSPAA
jgi:hypothetical protein